MHRARLLAAVLFSVSLVAGQAYGQRQVAKVTASNAAQGDQFGCATAIDGDWAVIGARYNNDRAALAGSAYVFHRVNGVWSQTQELLASDGEASDFFGGAVAMSGDIAVVGALGNHAVGTARTGAAYVFERAGAIWIERAKLVASDASSGAQFGFVVAISGDRVAVGAWAATPFGSQSGRAYVFERNGSAWFEAASLIANDEASGDAFGESVAIDGDWLAVGAPNNRTSLTSRPGATYAFARSPQGQWSQQQKLIASDGLNADAFGLFVNISGSTIAVGSPYS